MAPQNYIDPTYFAEDYLEDAVVDTGIFTDAEIDAIILGTGGKVVTLTNGSYTASFRGRFSAKPRDAYGQGSDDPLLVIATRHLSGLAVMATTWTISGVSYVGKRYDDQDPCEGFTRIALRRT